MVHGAQSALARWSVVVLSTVVWATVVDAGDRSLTFADLMQFRQIRDASIAADGGWVAYALVPDRGDGEVVVRSTATGVEYRVERGAAPEFSADGRWLVAAITPTLEAREAAARAEGDDGDDDDDDEPKKGLAVLDLELGEELRIDEVERFALSADGRWLGYQKYEEKKAAEVPENGSATPTEIAEGGSEEPDDDQDDREVGTTLVLRDLATGDETVIEHVSHFAFAESEPIVAFAISAPDGEGNAAVIRRLGDDGGVTALHRAERGRYTHLSWAKDVDRLAFVAAVDDEDGEPGDAEVWVWTGDGEALRVASRQAAPGGWTVPSANELVWSRDGERLFFGMRPVSDAEAEADADVGEGEAGAPFDPYDLEAILEDREVDVWHWRDPRIIPNQKQRWEEHEKDRVWRAVVHLGDGRVVPLAGLDLPEVVAVDNRRVALGRSDLPYLRELTWDGEYLDLCTVDLRTGDRRPVARRLAAGRSSPGSLSPDGRFVLFFQAGDWHLHEVATGAARNLTAGLGVPFADEDWDYPSEPPGYGHSEWLADASAVLVYDRYDIWRVATDGSDPVTITGGRGRAEQVVLRVVDLDPEEEVMDPGAALLVEGYDDRGKHDALYALDPGGGELHRLYGSGRHRIEVVAKAEHADRLLFTRERYDEFPDLWTAGPGLADPVRLSDANPQLADFAWGSAELVEWASADGVPLQGVLIRPGNYQPGRRYPVLVYFYRLFSERLHLFNEPVVNHRPSFPLYASNGYAVFLPDVRFEVGRPGQSAVKCLVPGVQKLVDMGLADPGAVGLHGHSWSGYQTAFVITQTDYFAAAVAGAPVANMTSAYSGIRGGTGLARQFQYERSQSRLGASLWQARHLYIDNSPVFAADRIATPLLIQFGDEDEAVPWTQGIELYLACRRLDKNCIMLQYRGEPHHLQQYPNKLDYSIKMKQFFDHHLKGEPAPAWMTDSVPYTGE